MSFRDPQWLWLLALLPAILLLARRGLATRRSEVASLVLWKKALAAIPSADISRRRAIPLSLWLWLLMFAALVLALADPEREVRGEARVLLLVDDGPRMEARDPQGRRRWESLQEKLGALLETMGNPRVRFETLAGGLGVEGSPAQIRSRLLAVQPARKGARLDRAIAIRQSSFSSFDAIVFAGDREPRWGESSPPAQLQTLLVGAPSQNVGWVGLFRANEGISVVARNFSSSTQSRSVVLEVAGRMLEERPLSLAAYESREISFSRDALGDPAATIRLEPTDEFSLDDFLRLVELPRELRVRIPAELPPALRKAFAAIPETRAVEVHGKPLPVETEAEIFLRDAPEACARPVLRMRLEGEVFSPRELRGRPGDDLGRLLGFEGVRVEAAHRPPAGSEPAQVLASASDAAGREWPILWREGEDLAIAFDLTRSDWDRHPSFPVFWAAWVEEIRLRRGAVENFLQPEQSDTNGVTRELGRLELPQGSGIRREPISDLLLLAAMLAFLGAAALEWRRK